MEVAADDLPLQLCRNYAVGQTCLQVFQIMLVPHVATLCGNEAVELFNH